MVASCGQRASASAATWCKTGRASSKGLGCWRSGQAQVGIQPRGLWPCKGYMQLLRPDQYRQLPFLVVMA